MKVEIIKNTFEPDEREVLLRKVKDFDESYFCEGINCEGVNCGPDCPIYALDELAKELRSKTLQMLQGAD